MFCDGELVADHERIWAVHQTVSIPHMWRAGEGVAAGTNHICQ